ncbi:hypothetical protein GCM10009837_30400 [Streptomyces durmitorensis]|uniref:ATP-binding protein n=1 Tax=Streptomyces durmitorensis TaxID=319947 RepID=A0ABY4Q0R1_9ACTN|nr:hypothetical protein [Streptomyces durmitorensis]UQT58782.1 hypothetical protein M4V62_29065 [Streptomyces durmitorensis]
MKIVKAAAGVVGVGLALGAVSPAFAAPQPPAGGETQMLDSAAKATQDLKNPLSDVDVDAAHGELKADPASATAKVDDAVQGPASMIGGLPAGMPIG